MDHKDLSIPYNPPGPAPKPVKQSEFMDENPTLGSQGGVKGRPGKNRLSNGMTLAAYAREYGTTVIDVLAEILQNEQARPSDRIAAGNTLLDRGFGKAVSVIGDETGEPVNLAQVLIGIVSTRPDPQDAEFPRVIEHRAEFVSPPKPEVVVPPLAQDDEDLDPYA